MVSLRSAIRAAVAIGGPALLIGLLARPLFYTNAQDWLPHLWLMWHQSLSIRADHLPSFFVNYSHSVFYPEYAFYGGTLYALVGTLSLALGDAPLETYIATYVLGFMAAYGGWYWIARIAGLGGWCAHVPGFVFVTSASYLTIVYARGDWPEFLAISSIPLMVAAALSILRSDRLRVGPALALSVACVIFFGSHSLTLLWGSLCLSLLSVAIVALVPQARRHVTRRRVLNLLTLAIPALLVSAWFLLPGLAYESHTFAGSGYNEGSAYWHGRLHAYMFVVAAKYLFTLDRASPPGSIYVLALPVLAIVWVIVAAALLLRARLRDAWGRALLIMMGMTLVTGLTMTHEAIVLALPFPLSALEFSLRLESYVLLSLSGAILAALVLAGRSEARHIRLWTLALIPVMAVSAVGALRQLALYPHEEARERTLHSYLTPVLPGGAELLGLKSYYYNAVPTLGSRPGAPRIYIPPTSVHDDRATVTTRLRPGQLAASNIAGGPELVHITGAKIVGVSQDGNDVIEVDRGARAGTSAHTHSTTPVGRISVSPAHPLPVVLGRLLTLIGAIALVARLVAVVIAARRGG